MESVIKNVNHLKRLLTKDELNKINAAAALFASHAQVFFKIEEVDKRKITVSVRQHQTSDNQYFTSEQLTKRCSDLFKKFFPYYFIEVKAFSDNHLMAD
ncbi:hypothetical protein [Membranihabitans marinus]|uniref:hypothetical protein n=1 Tax=Membranihabitans marinus TaxID=1227546 RepID=UPI001F180E34|nr:hypothetical protein [Membranihabitans marinus]